MAFTMNNTTGYTQAELDALNAELASRLAKIDPNDTDALIQAEKNFDPDDMIPRWLIQAENAFAGKVSRH